MARVGIQLGTGSFFFLQFFTKMKVPGNNSLHRLRSEINSWIRGHVPTWSI